QLAGGLAGHGGQPAARDLRRSRRLRHAAAVLLRLCRQPQGVAPLDGAARAGGHAQVQAPRSEVSAARVAILVGAMMAMGALGQAHGQTSGPSSGDGVIHAVTYVEVLPTSTATALAILKRYREATRREDGNLGAEVVQRIGEPHEFVVLCVWRDRAAFEAHGKGASATDTREKIAALRTAPTDQRVHTV